MAIESLILDIWQHYGATITNFVFWAAVGIALMLFWHSVWTVCRAVGMWSGRITMQVDGSSGGYRHRPYLERALFHDSTLGNVLLFDHSQISLSSISKQLYSVRSAS